MAVSWLMIATLVFLLLPNKLHSQSSDATIFNFTSFQINEPDLIFQGDAFSLVELIFLTTQDVGRVLYSPPIRLWDRAGRRHANFQTVFRAFMCAEEGRELNGISFFMAPVNATIPLASTGRGNMGLYDASSGTSPVPLVAVELDRYVNSWDPNYRHVGININSRNSVAVDRWEWNTTGSNMPYPGLDIGCFTIVETRTTYDARQSLISVIANATSVDLVPVPPPFIGQVEFSYDLTTILPEWVQIGFSASAEIHVISSWSFISFLVSNDVNQQDEDNYNRQDA